MKDFIALMAVGLSFGSAYALLGLSINIIYSSSNTLNFAQGEFMMLGGMLGWLFYSEGELPYIPAFLLVALVTGVIGIVEYYLRGVSASLASSAANSGHYQYVRL